jgi:hypothetical protein
MKIDLAANEICNLALGAGGSPGGAGKQTGSLSEVPRWQQSQENGEKWVHACVRACVPGRRDRDY